MRSSTSMARPDTFSPPPRPLLFLGCGNMGGAILRGLIAGGADPSGFHVCDPHARDLPDGVVRVEPGEGGQAYDTAILAVKPQLLKETASEFRSLLADDALVVSILAGVREASLAEAYPGRRVARLMPNLAAASGQSPMALSSSDLSGNERQHLSDWLSACGPVQWFDEEMMDLVTALAGSGPAYLYRFIDALSRAAVSLGMSREAADGLAMATVEGAAKLAADSRESPGELAERVASPGGSTREGLNVLDSDDALLALLTETLRAARDRNVELAEQFG